MTAPPPPASSAGPIVVYGATGFTGKLVSLELARRGADFRIAGRNPAKLEALAAELADTGASVETAAVSLDDRAGLRSMLADAATVVSCAGPFTLLGEPVIEAAAESGVNYLDTTGEQPFIRDSFDRWGAPASASGATLVSGMGFDYAPGDLLASVTAGSEGAAYEELTVAYALRGFGATRGTALSALEMIKGGDVEWRNGKYFTAPRNIDRGSFPFPEPVGEQHVGRYPAGEQITVPRHVDVGRMNVLIDLRSLLPVGLGPLGAPAVTLAGRAMATPLKGLIARGIARLPEGPSEEERRGARFTLVCEARRDDGGMRRGVLRGVDVYGLTATIISEAAQRLSDPGWDRGGALAPAEAFDATEFLAALAPAGISYEVEET